jgi:tetratricopeptide (TPR) repeat protein
MKAIIRISLVFYLFAIIYGCGGNQKIKGIAERDMRRPQLPKMQEINYLAFQYFVNGTILESMGDIYSAKEQYARALDSLPSSNLIRYSYSSMLAETKEYRRSLDEAMRIIPKDIDTWLLIGNDYRSLAIFDSALISYQKALKLDSNIASVYYFIGAYYQQANNLDSVIWAHQHIARLMQDYNSYQHLANFQLSAGYVDQAKQSFIQSLTLDSSINNIRSYLALSAIYEESGDKEEARKMTEAAEKLEPNDLMIQKRLLRFYEEEGFLDKGIQTALKIDSLEPDNITERRLGILYYRADSLDLADSIFASLISGGDSNLVNYYYSGQISYDKEKYDLSKEFFRRLTVAADTILDGWMNLARVYYAQDSIEGAIEVYTSGLNRMRTSEDSMIIMYALAAAYERQNKVDQAIELFETILTNQPNNRLALNYLGYMLADRGMRLEYARELILRALDLDPENGAFIDSYGWVLYKLGDYRAALQVLLQAVRLIDNDPVVFEHVGDAYQALGDFKKAREFWGKAYQLDPNSQSLKEKLYQ